MTVNNFINGVNAGFGVVDKYEGMKRRKVQQGKEDEAWDRQNLIQDRTLALQDLDLALKSNDFVKFSDASKVLGLSVPSFESNVFNTNKKTYEAWIGGSEPISSDGMASLMNDVMRQDIAKREGANPNYQYRVNRLVPSPDGKGFQVELKVKDKETGKEWNAPMTNGATVGEGTVQTIPVDKVVKRLEGYFQVGDAVHANPENSKEFDEALAYVRTEAKKQFQNNYMQEKRYGFGVEQRPTPKEPKSHVINDQLVIEQPDGSFGVGFDGRDQQAGAPETKVVNNQLLERSENGWVMQYDGRDDNSGGEPKREMKQDVNGRWRYLDDGSLAFPDVEVQPKSSDANPYSGLSYDKAIYSVLGNALGFRLDSLGALVNSSGDDGKYDVANEELLTMLSSIGSEYAKGKNISHTTASNAVISASKGLTLKLKDAMDVVSTELGFDLSSKLEQKNPEQYNANQQEVMARAKILVDKNIEILQDRLTPKTEQSGQGEFSHIWKKEPAAL